MSGRSKIQVVRVGIDVKAWAQQRPTAEQARPAHCPACGGASRPVGRRMLHGHGLRRRQAWGPAEVGARPQPTVIEARRYTCQHRGCGAVVVAVPRALVPWRRYTAGAIALGLALWSVAGWSSAAVRREVSPGAASFEAQWSTVRRWARQAEHMFSSVRPSPPQWSLRSRAERAAMTLASWAPLWCEGASTSVRAFAGAEHGEGGA